MNYWEEIAEKVAEDFGVMVDDEDRFFQRLKYICCIAT